MNLDNCRERIARWELRIRGRAAARLAGSVGEAARAGSRPHEQEAER